MALDCLSCGAPNDDDARFCSSCGTRLARTCPSCGASIGLRARFCPECGTRLGGEQPPLAVRAEERRFVSILFADLAGFTHRSDRADPEDVRRILLPFHALAKEEIERFGGTLDKFIGDAAMGVFGAPVAHEDDPERAVRAALAIRERVTQIEMPVRVAVHAGEAIVTFAAGPQIGENVAGDVVNTASRLQGVAPVGGVVVGESVERATRGVVTYDPMEPVRVKGKADPVPVWLARALRETAPSRDEDDPPPFVGRERERLLLRDLLARAERERCVHLVTVVGEPGIGKSRLVADLGDHVRGRAEEISWLRGRCLPYGEAITFAPLEEIVRAAAGIHPSDAHDAAGTKLAAEIARLEVGPEGDWLVTGLSPLVGRGDAATEASPARPELFAAWTRFLEAEARRAPLVLVVEDLHWADEAMLAFLDHLAEAPLDAPILVLATGRPDLFTRHPSWGGGKANATTISLSPLAEDEMRELLGALLVRSVLPNETHAPLMARAGGNPLYALEFVHMLEDREQGAEPGETFTPAAISVPDTVQALIAARLDALEPTPRALLHDAAIVGDRFWPGALSALEPATDDVDGALRELQRRGLVRRASGSAIEGQDEFGFAHAVIRDVAYGQLPRAARARGHRAVTAWLETAAGDRTADLADLLAFHAVQALELHRTANLDDDVAEFQGAARRFLVMAGERQQGLDAGQAADHFARAAALAGPDDPERADLLRRATSLGWRAGKLTSDEAVAAYRESLDIAMAADDRLGAARAMRRLYFQLGQQGDTVGSHEVLDEAIVLLEATPDAGPTLAELYACRSEVEMFAGRSDRSLDWAQRSLKIPSTEKTTLMALHLRGNARCELGDLGGLDDLRDALRLSEESGRALDIVTSCSYLLEWTGLLESPEAALEMSDRSLELCTRRGLAGQEMWTRAERLWLLYDVGRWDEIIEQTDVLEAWSAAHGDTQSRVAALPYRARVLARRGQLAEARALAETFLPLARQIGDLQIAAPAVMVAAVIEERAGRFDEALKLLREFDETTSDGPAEYRELLLPEAVRACLAAGDVDLARQLMGARDVHAARTRLAVGTCRAALAEADGDLEAAAVAFGAVAGAWDAWGAPAETACALAGRARVRRALGDVEAADEDVRAAQARFAALGIE